MTDRTPQQDFDLGGTHSIKNAADPSGPQDYATKAYVDSHAGGDVAGDTHAATSKVTPVDADEMPLVDSAASYGLKKLLWSNVKATLKAYFDTVYTAIGASAPPNGSAGGDLGGTYPNPTVAALHETTGPTKLTLGSVPDGDYLVRSGTTIVGGSPTPGGPPTGSAGGDLSGTYPNPTIAAGKVTLADLAAAVTPGLTQLVYRYTVAGSDKASIDTGVDTPDAGSNDWSNGDLLEVYIVARTDVAGATDTIDVTLNNDGGSHYDNQRLTANSTTVTGGTTLAAAFWQLTVHGSGGLAGYAANVRLSIPDYAGTTFNKVAEVLDAVNDSTAGNEFIRAFALGWRNTAAISRVAIACESTAKFKVGTQLLIYKRLAS